MHIKNPLKSILLAITIILICGWGSMLKAEETYSQSAADDLGTLRIAIQGLKSDDGVVKVGLYDSEGTYTSHKGSFKKAELSISNLNCEWILKGVPQGEYALMLYHDENGNHKLDKNMIGIPKEPYGFSNNVKPGLGLPDFKDVKFLVDVEGTLLEIEMQ